MHRRLRIAPEFRYTRWISSAIDYEGLQGYRYRMPKNQIDLLLNIGWKVR